MEPNRGNIRESTDPNFGQDLESIHSNKSSPSKRKVSECANCQSLEQKVNELANKVRQLEKENTLLKNDLLTYVDDVNNSDKKFKELKNKNEALDQENDHLNQEIINLNKDIEDIREVFFSRFNTEKQQTLSPSAIVQVNNNSYSPTNNPVVKSKPKSSEEIDTLLNSLAKDFEEEKYSKYLKNVNTLIQQHPKHMLLHYKAGFCHLYLFNPVKAKECFFTAYFLSQKNRQLNVSSLGMAVIHLQLEKYDSAILNCQELLIHPSLQKTSFMLCSLAYFLQGDNITANTYFNLATTQMEGDAELSLEICNPQFTVLVCKALLLNSKEFFNKTLKLNLKNPTELSSLEQTLLNIYTNVNIDKVAIR